MTSTRAAKTDVRRMRTICSAIIRDGGKVLLIKRSDYNVWELPGGGIEFGESPMNAVIREVKEETALTVDVKKLVNVISVNFETDGKSVLERSHLVVIVYECKMPVDSLSKSEVVLDENHDEYMWVGPRQIPKIKNLAIGMRDILKDIVSGNE